MRILVLGGTAFLSREVAAEAVRRGHEVVCACRGASGSVPDGARLVVWDRAADAVPPAELTSWAGGALDAVVDVARHPSWVRHAVAAFPDAHWTFVSTMSVYADAATPGQGGPGVAAPLLDAVLTDEDPTASPETYGAMKVGCEELVRDGARAAFVPRPGLIVGPDDPTGRFSYWPERLASAGTGEEVLAGGDPGDLVQVVDVRDLAAWIVTSAERSTTGTLDAIGAPVAFGDLLADVARGVGSTPSLTWVADDVLAAHGVEPWAGDDALPLWLPRPAYDGMLAHDPGPARAAGLVCRPVAETARDTLAWLRDASDVVRTGLSRQHERRVLAAVRG